jgi:NAD(P)-dependent dehydrogenase (short-subunit alcohol dehydrogenase family)/threonine dehydrogenase-like Zn-dependent dehydrogenase
LEKNMGNDYQAYVDGTCDAADSYQVWPLYGVGLDNLGEDQKPVTWDLPEVGAGELLARVDACGLCFSDIKVLKLGHRHPRISGRDLQAEPVVLGHEVAMTIVAVGADRAGDYSVGDRFVIQAEIHYKGEGLAFGYALHGGLEQYAILGPPVLDGDDGCYLIRIDEKIGYSEAALAEPWACVECAFRVEHRRELKAGGLTLVRASEGCREGFTLGALADGPAPAKLVALDVPEALAAKLRAACESWGAEYAELSGRELPGDIDDLILLDPDADTVEAAGELLGEDGHLCLMTATPLDRNIEVDAGRIHYEGRRYVGAAGLDIGEAYTSSRSVAPIPGGKMLIAGAAGPMGQMHVQRALEMPDGPSLVVATDLDTQRLDTVIARFGALAAANDRELVCLNPAELGEAYGERIAELAPEGFDDIIMLVPAAPVISMTAPLLGDGAMYQIFAGVAKGTMVTVDVSDVALRGIRYTGTSGSAIDDLRHTVELTRDRLLAPNRAVAAIGGMSAVWDGLKAVQDAALAGKVVIYPHIANLPLTKLEDLHEIEPQAAALLDASGAWTREAEDALLARHVHGCPTPTDDPPRLTGKVALVTGAAQGLGEALAERLAREGCAVCIADINEQGASATADRIAQQSGMQVIACGMDVTDEQSVAAAMDRCLDELGGLDVVVSNAGILIAGATADFEVADWQKVIGVNLVGYFVVAKQAAIAMLKSGGGGSIIQVNSKSGKKGSFRNSAYAAGKFGGIGLTQSLALEFAEDGIRVNSVCPGNLLDSPLWVDSLYAQYAERWGITQEQVRQKYIDQVPMKRGCAYEDVANAVVFLASEQSSYMTGQAINVTGGQIMH